MNHGFTIEDIKRYIAGRMTPAEMHRIEKAALEDPFLADAIEGAQYAIENYGEEKFNSSTDELRKRIRETRSTDTRNIIGIWWKAAAVIVVLITAVAVIYFMNSERPVKSSTLAKVEHFEADTPAAARVAETIVTDTLPATQKKTEEKAARQKTAHAEKPAAQNDAAAAPKESMLHKRQIIVPQNNRVVEIDSSIFTKEETLAEGGANDTLQSALQGRAAGVVVQKKKNPTPPDTLMLSNAELSDVVVVGYGSAKNKNRSSDKTRRVTPEGGWKSFDEYINSNKRINSDDSLKSGTEEISFEIDSEGVPVNFKILRSLSPAHDVEAVRLLKEGPAWNVKKGKRKMRLKIRF
jgi:hypothetical protein